MINKVVKRDRTRKLVLTALFSALIAVGAFIKVQVGVVPFTMQMCFVSMAGLLMGGFYGGLSVLIYVLIGLMGVPIFAQGGGIMYVVNPTFGYLIGMIIGGSVCGYISHMKGKITWLRMILGVLAMITIVYICGLTHFYLVKTLYFEDAVTAHTLFVSCMLIFWPSDFLTCGLSIVIVKKLMPILERQGYMVSSELYRKKNGTFNEAESACNTPSCDTVDDNDIVVSVEGDSIGESDDDNK